MAATPSLLRTTAEAAGVKVKEAIARTARGSTVKVGGWILWTEPDSDEPDTLDFDGAEYAMVWKRKNNDTHRNNEIEQQQQQHAETTSEKQVEIHMETNADNSHKSETIAKQQQTAPEDNNQQEGEEKEEEEGWKKVNNKKEKENKKNNNKNSDNNNQQQLKNAKNAQQTKENKHALNEQTKLPNATEDDTIRTTLCPEAYKMEKNQVIYSNFTQGTTLPKIEAYLRRRGVLSDVQAKVQLFLHCKKYPAAIVTYTDEHTALVNTFLAEGYNLKDGEKDDRRNIYTNCFYGA